MCPQGLATCLCLWDCHADAQIAIVQDVAYFQFQQNNKATRCLFVETVQSKLMMQVATQHQPAKHSVKRRGKSELR